MRRILAALCLSFGLGCGAGSLPPVQTAQIVTSATATVLQLVAEILAQVAAQAEGQAAKCLADPGACVLTVDEAD